MLQQIRAQARLREQQWQDETRRLQRQHEALELAARRDRQRQDAELLRARKLHEYRQTVLAARRRRQQQYFEMEQMKLELMIRYPELIDLIIEFTRMWNELEERMMELEYAMQQEEEMYQLQPFSRAGTIVLIIIY